MHLQVKVIIGGSTFPDESAINESTNYKRGTFDDLLEVLERSEINIRGANGHRIEFGGTFSFWAGSKDWTDDQNDAETERAAGVLRDAGYDARVVTVSFARLNDNPGALREFVQSINGQGLWVEEILVSTPNDDGTITVQIFTSRT
jgi:hypothetical protein